MVEKLSEVSERVSALAVTMSDLTATVSDLKNFKFIAIAVAVIFGLGGGYGAIVLSQINGALLTAKSDLAKVDDSLLKINADLETRQSELVLELEQEAARLSADLQQSADELGRIRVIASGSQVDDTIRRNTDGDATTIIERYIWEINLVEEGILFFDATTFGGRDSANGALAGTYLMLSVDAVECSLDSSYYPPEGGAISLRSSASCAGRLLTVGKHELGLYFTWRTDNASVRNPPMVNWVVLAGQQQPSSP